MKSILWQEGTGHAYDELPSLTKGHFVFTFHVNTVESWFLEAFHLDDVATVLGGLAIGRDISPMGKKCIVENIISNKETGDVEIFLDLQENPIPIAIVLGALAAVGIGAYLILIKIEKIIRDLGGGTNIIIILVVIALILGGLYFIYNRETVRFAGAGLK